MIRALSSLLAIALAVPTSGQITQEGGYVSPCPTVFMYEFSGSEPGKWYGNINLSTDITLYALWLNIVLDSKADILGNWVGEVSTTNNLDFKIENTNLKISSEAPLPIRFFIQYNPQQTPPKLQAIRFNGREICLVEYQTGEVNDKLVQSDAYVRPSIQTTTTTTLRPAVTTSGSADRQHTTQSPQYWQTPKADNVYQVTPENKQQSTSTSNNWEKTKNGNNYVPSNIQQTTLQAQSWSQDNKGTNHKIKNDDKTQTSTNTPYWQQKIEVTTQKQTTLKHQPWNQVKVDNPQQVRTDNKKTTKADDRLQPTTASKLQSTAQQWPQTKVVNNQHQSDIQQTKVVANRQTTSENTQSQPNYQAWTDGKVKDNQQIRSQDKNIKPIEKQQIRPRNQNTKIKTDSLLPKTYEVTTQSQTWAQYTVDNKQQKRSEEVLSTTTTEKLTNVWQYTQVAENRNVASDDRRKIKTENKTKQDMSPVVPTNQYWPKIPVDNNQQIKTDRYTEANVKQSTRTETKFEIEDVPQVQVVNTLGSTSGLANQNPGRLRESPIYVRPQEIQSETLVPYVPQGTADRKQARPSNSYQQNAEDTQTQRNRQSGVKPNEKQNEDDVGKWSVEKTSLWSETQPNNGRFQFESAGEDYSRDSTNDRIRTGGASNPLTSRYQATTESPSRTTSIKTSEISDFDSITPKKDADSDYYFGGLPTIFIPAPASRSVSECGKVVLDKSSLSSSKIEGQWPWQIALYQQQSTVDFKYICGGTLVSRRHIVTAAHCVARKGTGRVVNKNTLTIYLGKYNLRTSVEGVQVKFVNKITIHPEYNATTFDRDLAILELREPVTYSNWVQPACLWPESEVALRNIVGKKGSVVGWGLETSGVSREELNLMEMPIVDQETCLSSFREFYSRFTSEYTYCAGYGSSTCNGDSGGGMVFKRGNLWYLRGLVSLSIARRNENRCDPNHYVVFTDIAKLLHWVEDNTSLGG